MESLRWATLAVALVLSSVGGANAKDDPTASLAPIQDDPRLPRVLLIGDSISMGYTLPTRARLAGKANVHRIPENGGPTKRGIEKIEAWLGEENWDVIHFNWGLHDLRLLEDGKQQVPLDQYEANLRELVNTLKGTGAKLIWASTTPVPPGVTGAKRSDDDVLAYNAAAKRVMDKAEIEINDLYAFAAPKLAELQLPKNVHFTSEGSQALAEVVAAAIAKALPDIGTPDESSANRTGFLERVIKDDGGEHKYTLFVPENYSPERKWPVLLFLHGAGERGTDNTKQVAVGIGPAIRKRAKSFPFITILPQCEDTKTRPIFGWSPDRADGKRALAILDQVESEYATDPDRIYLTGLSMGGFGTWNFAATYPDRFAAIAPVCGGGSPESAAKVAHLPVWCFHGGADPVVPPVLSRRMIEALQKEGAQPKYTEYPGVGHNSWDHAYDTDELYDWLLAHQRKPKTDK